MDKKRAGKTIRAQYEIYLNYVQSNDLFRSNKFDPKNPAFLQNCWKELCDLLNSTGAQWGERPTQQAKT
jgi:hypothetical protein